MKWKRFYLPDIYIGFLLLPVIGLIALTSSFVLPMLTSHAPVLVETKGAEADAMTKMLKGDFTSVARAGEKVRIRADGRYLDGGNGFVHDLTLGLGQGFSMPDKHAQQKFILKSMKSNGIELTYDVRFDHRDFGKNLITEDRGTIKIPWE